MNIRDAIDAVIDMVPNVFKADCGYIEEVFTVDNVPVTFSSERGLMPSLRTFIDHARSNLSTMVASLNGINSALATQILQEKLALFWLNHHAPHINWIKLLSYNTTLDSRTYENECVAINLLITGGSGSFDITSCEYAKIIDPLASSNFVYFAVDDEFKFKNYNYVSWNDVTENANYKFIPEFLHPYHRIIETGQWSVHKTSRGDLIILDKEGIRATKRKGKWTLYEPSTIKNMIVDLVARYRSDTYWLACNLFELILDISYKRHGALLIFDCNNSLNQFVTNKESLISEETADVIRANFRESIGGVSINSSTSSAVKKRLLLELASMDGALIYNTNSIIAFGAMIQAHPDAGSAAGARTTAAISAFRHGALPIKISSDGDITIYFKSRNRNGSKTCDAKLTFL